MHRDKYAYIGLWVKYALGKSSCVLWISPVATKKQRITVSVFLSTLQQTALFFKSVLLGLQCYTLVSLAGSIPFDMPGAYYGTEGTWMLCLHRFLRAGRDAEIELIEMLKWNCAVLKCGAEAWCCKHRAPPLTLQLAATHCNTLQQRTATHCSVLQGKYCKYRATPLTPHCNILQPTAAKCNPLQHTARDIATHCYKMQSTGTHYKGRATSTALLWDPWHCNTLQYTATHCNKLKCTATHCNGHTKNTALLSWKCTVMVLDWNSTVTMLTQNWVRC